jgi:hypothetical protein
MTPDPYQASGGPARPQSWNRYSYVLNDPVNHTDRNGLLCDDGCPDPFQPEPCDSAADDCGGGGGGDCPPGFLPNPGGGCDAPPPGPPQEPPPAQPPPPSTPPPPLPTCTLEVESRPLGYFGFKSLPDLHGYLVFTSSLGTDIIEGLHTGKLLTASANSLGIGDNPISDTDDGSITGTAVCGALPILQKDASKINLSNITYNGVLGPNSSSALSYFLESVNYLLIDGPWYTIPLSMLTFGYNTPLPLK